jgi:DNA-directed RNA polymerase beta' subunit
MERIVFDLLSSYRMYNDYQVHTHSRLIDVIAYVEDSLCRSLYPPDTPIGLIVSQSFSEPLTQIQLNRFHHSGEGSGLVSGVTRIKEIINCMKDIQTPSMTIVPLEGHTMDTNAIISVTLNMVLRCWTTTRINNVTLVLDKSLMVSRFITPRILAEAIGHLHEHVQYTHDLEATTWEVWFPLEGTPLRIRDAARSLMKTNILITGIKNIADFYLSTIDIERLVDGIPTMCKQPCLITRGSNMREICKLPWVDVQYTTTNDLMEIYTLFGIDAMCTSIEENLLHVMSSNSADVSRSYIHIIAHEMCRTGTPCALTFNGLTSSKTSTLKLATFERSLESFVRAACIGHTDKLRGISESVIVGKPVSVGTGGDFELIDDGEILFDTHMKDYSDNYVHLSTIEYKRTNGKRKRDVVETQEHQKTREIHETHETKYTKPKKSKLSSPHVNPFLNSDHLFIPHT